MWLLFSCCVCLSVCLSVCLCGLALAACAWDLLGLLLTILLLFARVCSALMTITITITMLPGLRVTGGRQARVFSVAEFGYQQGTDHGSALPACLPAVSLLSSYQPVLLPCWQDPHDGTLCSSLSSLFVCLFVGLFGLIGLVGIVDVDIVDINIVGIVGCWVWGGG